MTDLNDKHTPDMLPPLAKRRGRPPTGSAMTPAEKQKAYRQRKKQRLEALKDPTQPVKSTVIDLSELPPVWRHQQRR